MKNIIMDFEAWYKHAKKKVKLNLWTPEYAKGYIYFFLNNVAEITENEYEEYAKMIDEID